MIYHIVTGDFAAQPLKEAISLDPAMAGEVIVIKDVLSVGPIRKEEGKKFSEVRSEFWQRVVNNEKPVEADDLERLVRAGNELLRNEKASIWIWIAPWPADVATYLWSIKYLGKYLGRLNVVNIAGLPFLDENGKIFFPKAISEILPKELVKAKKLSRPVTPSELEIDCDEWVRLTTENTGIRILEGGKRLKSVGEDYYDSQLYSFCSQQFQKASKIVNQTLSKFTIPTGDLFLGWRLRRMGEGGRLDLQGDVTKGLKDFEVKVPDSTLF